MCPFLLQNGGSAAAVALWRLRSREPPQTRGRKATVRPRAARRPIGPCRPSPGVPYRIMASDNSSGCGLNSFSLELLLRRAVGTSRTTSLGPQEPSRAAAGGLRASRLRGLATALSWRTEAPWRRGRLRAVRVRGALGYLGNAWALSTPSSSRGAMAAISSSYGDVSEREVPDCLERVPDRSVCREVPFCDTLRAM